MLTPLSSFARLTAADFHSRKRRWIWAAVMYGIAGICALFAVGFGATALAVWIAALYDPIIALVITAALFLVIAAIALIVNSIYQTRAKRRIRRNAALRSAAVATAMVSLRRTGTAALPIAAVVAGALLATQLTGGDDDADE